MKTTRSIQKLSFIGDCEPFITLDALASPLLNVEHMCRIALYRNKKESGTTMPLVLFCALKLRYMEEIGARVDSEETDAQVHVEMRRLLTEIQALAQQFPERDVLISKTFQEKIFRYVVWREPMVVSGPKDLLDNNETNRAHTVSGSTTPSCTIPSYLCRWILEQDRLNTKGNYKRVNSHVRQVARETFQPLKSLPAEVWQPHASFSRRVQNRLFLQAFKGSFALDVLNFPLKTPK